MEFFKPEDFSGLLQANCYAAQTANRLLQERSMRVWFNDDGTMNEQGRIECTNRQQRPLDTHQALLVCIEELLKKECVHEGQYAITGSPDKWECMFCRATLKEPKWETEK